MLTTHLLTLNNAKTIETCLISISALESDILVIDLGSTDETIRVCQDLGATVLSVEGKDRSFLRNSATSTAKTPWHLYVEPWEKLERGHEEILYACSSGEQELYCLNIITDNIFTKETRLWKGGKAKFVRPTMECLEPFASQTLNVFIRAGARPPIDIKTIVEWKRNNQTAADADYYLACAYLERQDYTNFLKHAKHFLFKEQTITASLMTSYYCGIVENLLKNHQEALQWALKCVSVEPRMAEFWCLLGDIFVQLKQWSRASAMYDNAVLFGRWRPANDPYPIDISKYKSYPEAMKEKCRQILMTAFSNS